MVRPRLRPPVRDAALALALAAVTLAADAGLYFGGPVQRKLALTYFPDPAGLASALVGYWVFGALLCAGMVVAHRWPLVALVLVGVGGVGHQLDPRFAVRPLDLAVPFVLYVVASSAVARWVTGAALGATVLTEFAVRVRDQVTAGGKLPLPGGVTPHPGESFLAVLTHAATGSFEVVLVLVLAVAIGDGVRSRRANVRMLELRAADLEREQQHRSELAAAGERARISREMHDVVAHSLSVIVAQAQGAAAALGRHPERAATAMANVIDTGRRSLAEMRQLLGVVRRGGPDRAEPGVAGLPALVDQMCAAGLAACLEVAGEPVPLPAGVDLSAYRIVQEALTNALKHAGVGTSVSVRLAFADDALLVDVTDDGRARPVPAAPSTNGHGLRGIAERVHLLGGDMSAGPVGESVGAVGFRVHARLPVGAQP